MWVSFAAIRFLIHKNILKRAKTVLFLCFTNCLNIPGNNTLSHRTEPEQQQIGLNETCKLAGCHPDLFEILQAETQRGPVCSYGANLAPENEVSLWAQRRLRSWIFLSSEQNVLLQRDSESPLFCLFLGFDLFLLSTFRLQSTDSGRMAQNRVFPLTGPVTCRAALVLFSNLFVILLLDFTPGAWSDHDRIKASMDPNNADL